MSKRRTAGLETKRREPKAGVVKKASPTKELTRVEEANYAFYEAFSGRDIEKMDRLWSHTPYARCIHPGWDPVVGWHDIRQSWVDIFRTMHQIDFELADVHVEVNESTAWVNLVSFAHVVTEDGEEFDTSVIGTTVFERIEDEWLIVLHHASHYVEDDEEEEALDIDSELPPRGGSGTFEPN